MNYEVLLGNENNAVKVGIGNFGASLLARSKKMSSLEITWICDKNRSQMDVFLSACGMNSACVAIVQKFEVDQQDVSFDILVEAT